MTGLVKRHLLVYFKDKMNVFFSLLSVLILIALYIFFLSDLTASGIPEFPAKKALLNSWFLANVIAICSMTTTLGGFGTYVEDQSTKRYMDFYAAPIARQNLLASYVTSSLTIGFIMSFATLMAGLLIIWMTLGYTIDLRNFFAIIGVLLLTVCCNATLILFLISRLRSSNAFAAASTVFGTLLGFLAGIYIPIGALPDYLQIVVKFFPLSHSVSLFRELLMEQPLQEAFLYIPAVTENDFLLQMGITYEFNGIIMSSLWRVLYLIFITLIFSFLTFISLRKKV